MGNFREPGARPFGEVKLHNYAIVVRAKLASLRLIIIVGARA